MLMSDFHWHVKRTVNNFECKSQGKKICLAGKFQDKKQGQLKTKENFVVCKDNAL